MANKKIANLTTGSIGLTDVLPFQDAAAANEAKKTTVSALQNAMTGKQNALGFTPENVANKSTDGTFASNSDTLYPTVKAAKTYSDALAVGLLRDRGNYNASTNLFPSTGGSGAGGAVRTGDLWYIANAGTLGGTSVLVGYSVRALVDNPAQTPSNWAISNVGLGYVPENVANKSTDVSLGGESPSDTLFPSQAAVKTYVDETSSGKQDVLVSGENIKTINGESILGAGNIEVGGGGGGGDNVIVAKISVSSAELLNLHTLVGFGKLLVPAQGTGKCILPLKIVVKYNYGTTPYSSAVLSVGFRDELGSSSAVTLGFNMNNGSSTYFITTAPNGLFTNLNNFSLFLGIANQTTGGDGTLDIYVTYTVIDL